MLGVAPAIVNRDSRPVQTRVGVDTFVVPRVQAPRGQRGRGPAAIRWRPRSERRGRAV